MDKVTFKDQAHSNPTSPSRDWSWPFWPVVPLYPYGQRRTLRREIVKGTLWTFEQIQGILYVVVPIRMTVARLENGGLLVYAPIAPTPECVRLMRELEEQYGEVAYIILPTVSGLEHKVFVGPFARRFSKAQVYVAPGQWSYPVKLPLSWLGFPLGRTYVLPENSHQTPFSSEFDYAILGPINLGLGSFGEVAFFHKRSRTLLVTDSVVSIPETPPAIVQLDPYPLLFHARNQVFDEPDDTWETRCKGWQRIVLFAFYFRPGAVETVPFGQALRDSRNAGDRSKSAYFGFFPFRWKKNWKRSFDILWGNGRLLVAPILQTLILNRAPKTTLDWAYHLACWDFRQIVPCHFEAPIDADGHALRHAFEFLEKGMADTHQDRLGIHPGLPDEDLELLNDLNAGLTQKGITPPPVQL